jgi:hypothetical protein
MKQKNLNGMIVLFLLLGLAGNSLAQPIFGPTKVERATGAPEVQSSTFQACNTGAVYRLVVENGAAGKDRVSSATVNLNGVEVVRPSELNQKVERFEKEVTLQGENTLAVRLSSNPGGFLTVSLFCASGCMDVSITSPPPGSTVNRSKALVQGSLTNAPGEVGVVLASSDEEGQAAELAQVQGDLFADLVPLQLGDNTLSVTATDACGYQVRKEVTVQADVVQEKVRLSALPDSGILGATSGTFETELEVNTYLPAPITQYAWDFDGDGTAEQTGADLTNVTAQYGQAGIYFPRVTVTDAQGTSFWETTVVNVLTREEMDARLKTKWAGLKGALIKKDFDKALSLFSQETKELYGKIFTALAEQMPEIAAGFGEIQLVSVQENEAKYRIIRDEMWAGQTYPISYEIIFSLDENGIWKIVRF